MTWNTAATSICARASEQAVEKDVNEEGKEGSYIGKHHRLGAQRRLERGRHSHIIDDCRVENIGAGPQEGFTGTLPA